MHFKYTRNMLLTTWVCILSLSSAWWYMNKNIFDYLQHKILFVLNNKNLNEYAASKEDIIPPVPILTRYRRESGIKAFVKKELNDPRLPDMRKSRDINVLTTTTLCVQLNTLYVS